MTAAGRAIVWVRLGLAFVPLKVPTSDAKVFTGRQKPLTQVAILLAQVATADGQEGLGFSYSKRAGGPALYAHAEEIAADLLGEDSSDIGRLWEKLQWAGASVGRGGLAVQAIAAVDVALWDLKAKRAALPLARLLGAHRDAVRCYNTSGGFLSSRVEEVLENAQAALAAGVGGIKLKVGHPDAAVDLQRVEAARKTLGQRVPLMVDANQQWDRSTAQRMGRVLEQYDLVWIEEPLDAQDAEGHAALAMALDTPIATGEMLTSVAEHWRLLEAGAADYLQPDAPRVGGITPFLRVAALADHKAVRIAPHFAMELHLHLAAAQPRETWVEHFDWLEPLFEERLELRDGRMVVPERPGLGLTLSEQAARWTAKHTEIGRRP
ncbi:MAG: L-talarate dehydratase @ Galactarate dehydratase [uncultured Chloroflexi bacterium]|uniref:L-talarate dehydratase @ Galactarate dehydratase n=1 Tax=uncultured Chloroflexota bacterium TaxID=166587 RepID=A0A6J4HTK3_9CHLR|nr:MAG: L-talarate dehydratase @ Galactarate dehydratase [uncultured Chloroflexota bacterium]